MKINSFTHKKGRPTKMGQLQIQREIRPYFEKGISAIVTAGKTGIDKKTVNKYFDYWAEAMLEVEESKSLERQEMERVRIIASYDYLLLDAYRHFDDIDDQINQLKKEKKPIAGYLFSLRSDAMKFRAFMFEKKIAFLRQNTKDDEVLERKIEELIRKYEIPRLVLGKYLKLVFDTHEKSETLDTPDINQDGNLDVFDLGSVFK